MRFSSTIVALSSIAATSALSITPIQGGLAPGQNGFAGILENLVSINNSLVQLNAGISGINPNVVQQQPGSLTTLVQGLLNGLGINGGGSGGLLSGILGSSNSGTTTPLLVALANANNLARNLRSNLSSAQVDQLVSLFQGQGNLVQQYQAFLTQLQANRSLFDTVPIQSSGILGTLRSILGASNPTPTLASAIGTQLTGALNNHNSLITALLARITNPSQQGTLQGLGLDISNLLSAAVNVYVQ